MTRPSRITDESVFVRRMGLESTKMNEGLVKQRKSLAILLAEKKTVSVTKKEDTSHFDLSVIATRGRAVHEDLQRQLRLPNPFSSSLDTPLKRHSRTTHCREMHICETNGLLQSTGADP